MGRIPRKNKSGQYSPEFLQHIKLMDFMGRLSTEEIEIAIANGLHRWNLWKLASKSVTLTMDQHKAGIRVAPVFDGTGQVDLSRYPKKQKFIITNYDDLKAQYTR